MKSDTLLSDRVKHVARLLLSNGQGGALAPMTVCPEEPVHINLLRGIVVHTICILRTKEDISCLQFFSSLLDNPTDLIASLKMLMFLQHH